MGLRRVFLHLWIKSLSYFIQDRGVEGANRNSNIEECTDKKSCLSLLRFT